MTVHIKHRRRSLHRKDPQLPTAVFAPTTDLAFQFSSLEVHRPHEPPPVEPIRPTATTKPTKSIRSTVTPASTSTNAPTPEVTSSAVPTTTTFSVSSSVTSSAIASQISSSTHVKPTKTRPSVPPQSSTSSAESSATSSAVPSSNVNSGAIAGVVFGLVGLAGLVWLILFFMRRWRKGKQGGSFDASSFRRSAVVLPDSPTHDGDAFNRGYSPRPPTMIERKLANVPPAAYSPQRESYGQQQYEQAQQFGPQRGSGGAASQSFASFTPGQVLTVATPAHTPNSGDLLFSPSAYGPSPFSPLTPPVSAVLHDQPVRQPPVPEYSNRQSLNATQLTRQPSNGAGVAFAHSDYVDMSRSSISPFQAAQYAEIARRLKTEIPGPIPDPPSGPPPSPPGPVPDDQAPSTPDHKSSSSLDTVVEEFPSPAPPYQKHSDSTNSPDQHDDVKSPFTDEAAEQQSQEQESAVAESEDGLHPPSAAFLRPRIDSSPPVLPEIDIHQRTFSPTPFSSAFEHVTTPPLIVGRSYHSSPMAGKGPGTPMATAITPKTLSVAKRPDTTYTLSDLDDAYGGI